MESQLSLRLLGPYVPAWDVVGRKKVFLSRRLDPGETADFTDSGAWIYKEVYVVT